MLLTAVWAPAGLLGLMAGSLEAIGASIAITGIGGALVNILLPATMPNVPTLSGNDHFASQTYSWSPQTLQQQGSYIPRIYGTHRVYGNIIAAYTDVVGDDQYLNMLVALGMGQIQLIDRIMINDQPIAGNKNIEFHVRSGKISQSAIPCFRDTAREYSTFIKIEPGGSYNYTTVDNDFDGLYIKLAFPQGCFQEVKYTIKWRLHNSNNEFETITQTVKRNKRNALYQMIFLKPPKAKQEGDNISMYGQYEIIITRDKKEHKDQYLSELFFTGVKAIYNYPFAYPRLALVGIKALATNKLSGSIKFSCDVNGALIRVRNKDGTWSVEASNNPAWIVFDMLTQP